MDTYFRAAVSDLDKLLDEFEQSTDELENNRNLNPHDSKHHLLSSELDFQQPKFLGQNVQENISCPTADELSLFTQTSNVANYELDSEQNEKNVTGLDLLSMVDSGSSDKNQPSCLGRCSIPVCDLISDTGNLSHTKTNSECIQKLQPAASQCSLSLIGLEIALLPETGSNCSGDCNTDSGTQQQIDGKEILFNTEYSTAEKQSQLTLKTGSHSETNAVNFGGDHETSETLSKNESFDQTEQVTGFESLPVLATQLTSLEHSSKNESACEKLPCQPLVDQNKAKGQMIHEESGKQIISKEGKAEASNLPKTQDLNKNVLLPIEENPQNENMLVLDKTLSTKEIPCNLEKNINTTLNIVSTPEVSENVHTSLSCLPLAVTMCGSLVTTDDSNENNAQGEVVHAISVHSEKQKNSLSEGDLLERKEPSEQNESLNKTSQCWLGKPLSTDKEKVNVDNTICNCEPFSHQDCAATSSSFLAPYTETCSNVLSTDTGERALVDLAVDDDIIRSDMLVSDAELDAFLSAHCIETNNSKPLKEDMDDGLLESDVINDNIIGANKLDTRSDSLQAEMEFKNIEASLNLSCIESNPESNIGILVEKCMQIQEETTDHINKTRSEISDTVKSQPVVHNEGARPKHLLNFPPKAKISSKFSDPNIPGGESEVVNSANPNTHVSDDKTCLNSSFSYNNDKQSSLEGKGGIPVKVVEQAVMLGQKPSWVPDSEARNCMNCQAKFTFTKRRHHCRACGKVFCASCCNRKCKLQYLDKEERVCISCYESINKAQAFERMMSPTGPGPGPNSSISEYPTVPPLQEAQTSGSCPKEQKRVWFADGILPNGEVADTTKLSSGIRRSPQEPYPVQGPRNDTGCATTDIKPKDDSHVAGRTEVLGCPTSVLLEDDTLSNKEQPELPCNSDCLATKEKADFLSSNYDCGKEAVAEYSTIVELARHPVPDTENKTCDEPVSPLDYRKLCDIENYVSKEISLIPEDDGLPPLLFARGEKHKESLVEQHPSHKQVSLLLEESNPLTFILNANLLVNVKLLPYCSERCWYFSTNGLQGLGQAEIIILLVCLPNEEDIPKEIFKLFINIYKDAIKGKFIGHLENITFTEDFLGSKEHGGFLFVTPTFQELDDLVLPKQPFLFGILIHKQEVPWAKVFPIRLMLRLGAEYGVYPTPLTSIRHRKPVFGDIGHTVMNLLVDLRNYQYTLQTIDNLLIHLEVGRSCIKIPLTRYNEVMKVMNNSNEHVISIGASFSSEVDSHLVCIQNDDGIYQTQAKSATGFPRQITGASFVVFNGALKASSGFLAKSSIVEDGIMVQITQDTMDGLRQALREKKDFRITCGKVDSGDLREYVDICWVENEGKTNVRVTSPIDGRSMEGVQSERIVQEEYFEMNEKLIKCTEVFYLLKASKLYSQTHQLAKEIALASCNALHRHLKTLKSNGMNKIGIRVSMDTDKVEYQAGSGGQLLLQHYLNDLDSALIPIIHGGTSNATNLPLEIELIFFIRESLLT